jgi:hypothetical protein
MTYRRPLLILVATLLLNAVPLGTDVRAQPRRVEGRVVDASNEASLPFTNVAIVGSQRGTTTNENGRFLLAVDSLPVRLAISYIGYQRVERRVTPSTADSVVVRLKEKPVSMAEVVVEGRTGAYFTRKARERLERLSKKRRALTEPVRGFYRQKTFYSPKRNDGTLKEDTVYTEYMETFYNAFTSPFGIRGWSIKQARYGREGGRDEDGLTFTVYFKNFSTLTSTWFRIPPSDPAEEAKVLQPLHSDADAYFSFEVVGHVEEDGTELVKVAYQPRQNLDTPAFSGHLYIDEDTYVLHRYDGEARSPTPFLLNVQGEMKDLTLQVSVAFHSVDDPSVPIVDRVQFELLYDHLIRDLHRRYTTRSTFFVYDYKNNETFGTSDIDHDYAAIDPVEYDPAFWRNNPVLARTPADKAVIRSFEETGGFGRFVEKRVGSK